MQFAPFSRLRTVTCDACMNDACIFHIEQIELWKALFHNDHYQHITAYNQRDVPNLYMGEEVLIRRYMK